MTQIAFIGGGNMATSIIGGLVQQGDISAASIDVADPGAEQREKLHASFGVNTFENNLDAITNADVVIMAVKPQVMKDVMAPLKSTLEARQPLLISIAAGISMDALGR